MLSLKFHSFQLNWLWTSLFMMLCCTEETVGTVRWPWKPINLSIGYFEGQLKSNWTVRKRLPASNQWAELAGWVWFYIKNNELFYKTSLAYLFISKKSLWRSSCLLHAVDRDLLRLSVVFANRSFCWSDISMV